MMVIRLNKQDAWSLPVLAADVPAVVARLVERGDRVRAVLVSPADFDALDGTGSVELNVKGRPFTGKVVRGENVSFSVFREGGLSDGMMLAIVRGQAAGFELPQ